MGRDRGDTIPKMKRESSLIENLALRRNMSEGLKSKKTIVSLKTDLQETETE